MRAGGELRWEGRSPVSWPDWRDEGAYRPLLGADRSAFAWEWLRRDPQYRRDALADPAGTASAWGLARYADPHRSFLDSRPLWLAGVDPLVLRAEALGRPSCAPGMAGLGGMVSGFRPAGGPWHCLASNGYRSIRVDVGGAWDGVRPIDLRLILDGLEEAGRLLPTIRAFAQLCRSGRFPDQVPRSQLAPRRILMLRAYDALAGGAGQREMAEYMIDRDCALPNWRTQLPSVRSRVQRLVKEARRMGEGGYRRLLQA